MATQNYFGYVVRGNARPLADALFEASVSVERDGQTVILSGPLGSHRTLERAMAEGIAWGKVWIDMRELGYTDLRGAQRKTGKRAN
ncbi:hypothetical protein VSR17_19205 [Cupriavidus taiwanensis]|uniref:Uncharacterized protein n=1 Tax=Cupriavidus taiwanensis TaxID=164546 RepID=A0A375HHL2_9BURK|nr:hypothetical protein [Cupriavidus taiwanensis]SOY73109.1 conserved hypothetical protein [Cupriavidus taiwanensis]SOY73247.1 conserved hypothetical protein [Cupriavidus taiwanensis]SOY97496.1 conserved hypothetical protein [Cupriavidus taiwanensis]SOZ30934.1 conserved hypothetical protein [Cupriavidus taiwanensis]SPA19251.1 conserved hypothetical protein [Cupriavidus taiwanensis]